MNSNFNDNLKTSRQGFTLTELLFVVAIIAVLGAMAVGVLGKAQKDARIAATRSRITQIEAIMQTVIEDFEVRRLPFRDTQLRTIIASAGNQIPARERLKERRNLRRQIAAALLLAEFPGPLATFTDDGVTFSTNPNIGRVASDEAQAPVTSSTGLSFRDWADARPYSDALNEFLDDFDQFNRDDAVNPTAEMQFWQDLFLQDLARPADERLDLPGEYLYIILERINIDNGSALEALGPNVIANSDGDIYPEIVDAFDDSMQLRIVQVTDPSEDKTNWKQFTFDANDNGQIDANERVKLPVGYQFLDPSEPRAPTKIRFQIVSPNLEEIE